MVIDEVCPKCKHKFDKVSIIKENLSKHDYLVKKFKITLTCLDCDIDNSYELINDYEVSFVKLKQK